MIKKALPFFGCWNTGENQTLDDQDRGYSPDWQYEQIIEGRHINPTFELFTDNLPANIRQSRPVYFEPLWTYARNNELRLAFIGRNWEHMFKLFQPWASMTVDHPFVQEADGDIMRFALSPWNKNVLHWHDLGLLLGTYLRTEFAMDYPDPPFVYLGNNNEVGIADFADAKLDVAFPKYLIGADAQLIQREMWIGYELRRGELLRGLKAGCPEWADVLHVFAYTDFGGEFCAVESDVPGIYRYPWGNFGKLEFSGFNVTANIGYIPNWNTVEPHIVRSPQVGACNSKHALDVFRRTRPLQLETHFWNGKQVSPDVWKGVVRSVMWIMREESNRLFLGSSQTVADTHERDMKPLIDSVEEVHSNPILREFWQYGTLLENRWTRDWVAQPKLGEYDTATGYGHPYFWKSCTPPEEQDPGNRWYLQHVPINERLVRWVEDGLPRPMMKDEWSTDREHKSVVKVFAIAIEYNSQYLIHAHAPQGPLTDVEIHICPDGNTPRFTLTVDVSIEGSFWVCTPTYIQKVI